MKYGNPGDSYFHSYFNDNSTILDWYNSELFILFLNSRGGTIWHNGDYEEHAGNSLIFYNYNKKQKKYKSIFKFAQSNILITYDKKYEYSSQGDFIRKIDLNEENDSFGYKNNVMKLEKFEMKEYF